jgi:hypothetical protein
VLAVRIGQQVHHRADTGAALARAGGGIKAAFSELRLAGMDGAVDPARLQMLDRPVIDCQRAFQALLRDQREVVERRMILGISWSNAP